MEVITPQALLIAILGGAVGGYVIGRFVDPPVTLRRIVSHASLVGWLGTVFFVGRIAVAWDNGDPALGRLIAGLAIWYVFAIAIIPVEAALRARR